MSKPKFDRNYARRKLELVLRDLRDYTADEFWREISRIASGATGLPSAEQLKEHTKELEAGGSRAMIHYPDTDCEAHCDVRTAEPVCLVCLVEERNLLRQQLEGAERDRDSFADGLLVADFYTECPECGAYIDNGPHHPDCKYTDVIARARSIVDRQQPQGGEDE